MFMSDLKPLLMEHARSVGADLIGFASKERFADVVPEENPFAIFPEGEQSPGKVTRGTCVSRTNFGDYTLFGSAWLDDNFNS